MSSVIHLLQTSRKPEVIGQIFEILGPLGAEVPRLLQRVMRGEPRAEKKLRLIAYKQDQKNSTKLH
jgi:hypothetical protein